MIIKPFVRFAATAAVASSWAAAPALSQQAEVSETEKAAAVVQSVDMETREVLLRDEESGEVFVIVAGPEVRNLAQLEAGDVVEATYTFGVAARMAEAGAEGTAGAAVAGRAEEGEKPAGVVGESVTTVVTFQSWDASANVVTVENAEGLTRRIAVQRPEMQQFASKLTEGDRVEVTFTEAIAIGVVER